MASDGLTITIRWASRRDLLLQAAMDGALASGADSAYVGYAKNGGHDTADAGDEVVRNRGFGPSPTGGFVRPCWLARRTGDGPPSS